MNLIEDIFAALDKIKTPTQETGLELFSAMLAMDEEKFKIVVPALYDSFEQTFNTPDAKLALMQMMNAQGIKADELSKSFDLISKSVDEMDISNQKKDFIKTVLSIFVNAMSDSTAVAKRVVQIPIELCHPDAKLPTYSTDGAAAMDVYSPIDFTVNPGETKIIPLGFKVNIPHGYALLVQPRSGMSAKTKLRVANTPGLIDEDYHNEIGLIIENIEDPITDISYNYFIGDNDHNPDHVDVTSIATGRNFTISKGERCCQLRLIEVPKINWLPVDSIGNFENDHGKGFGSTGKF